MVASKSTMISDYLRTTSIHGLRYLTTAKNKTIRFIWFVCVLGSFTTAIYIIYLNVLNWENSPSVLTKAQPVLVENELEMPVATVCPRRPDYRSLIVNFFNKYYDHSDVSSVEINKKLKRLGVAMAVSEKLQKYSEANNDANPFEECFDNETRSTESCHFVRTLFAMDSEKNDQCPDFNLFGLIYHYAIDSSLDGTSPNEEELTRLFMEKCQGSDVSARRDSDALSSLNWQSVAFSYIVFFPLLKIRLGAEHEFLPLKSLDQYENIEVLKLEEVTDMGNLFGHLMNSGGFEEFSSLIIGKLFDDISEMLDIEAVADADDVLDLLAYFAYDSESTLTKRILNLGDLPVKEKCNLTMDNAGGCPKESLDDDEVCLKYCDLISEVRLKAEPLLVEMMEMSVDDAKEIGGNRSRSLLAPCKSGKEPCWNKIINDRGVCYTNYKGERIDEDTPHKR